MSKIHCIELRFDLEIFKTCCGKIGRIDEDQPWMKNSTTDESRVTCKKCLEVINGKE